MNNASLGKKIAVAVVCSFMVMSYLPIYQIAVYSGLGAWLFVGTLVAIAAVWVALTVRNHRYERAFKKPSGATRASAASARVKR